jgi:DNA-binding PadR family transcriptional regulator
MARRSSPPKAVERPGVDYTNRSYWSGIIKMSLSKFFVLCVLHEKPMHGYEVVQAVERTTKGCCSPTEGTVYPMLSEFEAGEYVTSHSDVVQGRERKVYTLTARGHEAFRTAVASWLEATDCILAGKAAAEAARRRRGKVSI